MGNPIISVIMSVFNGEKYLYHAIKSVLDQTFSDFEFIIIDDCSTDNSLSIVESFNDPRIIIIKNEKNLRLPASLNKGIKFANGKYIARMDADDICFPDRFKLQKYYLDNNPEYGAVFGNVIFLNENGPYEFINSIGYSSEEIFSTLLFYNPINHSNMMLRKSVFEHFSYNVEYPVSEDTDLWVRMHGNVKFGRLHNTTLMYRMHSNQTNTIYKDIQSKSRIRLKRNLICSIVPDASEDELLIHNMLSTRPSNIPYHEAVRWMERIRSGNKQNHIFNQSALERILWRMALVNASDTHTIAGTLLFGMTKLGILSFADFSVRLIFSVIEEKKRNNKALSAAYDYLSKSGE